MRARPAPSADADGELPLAPRCAHQQQVGDVGAGDQQHQAHRAQQHQQRRAHIAHNRIAQRLHGESFLRAHRLGKLAAKLRKASFICALACCTVTPGFSIAAALKKCPWLVLFGSN